jgi:N-acetylneuraminic acid mutarotase
MQGRSVAAASTLLLLAAGGCGHDTGSPTDPGGAAPASTGAALAADSWITRGDLTTNQYAGFTTAVVRNAAGQSIVYAIGGYTAADPFQSVTRVMAYNVATNTWSARAPLPAGLRFTNQAAVIEGKIYVSGGVRLQSFYQPSLYVYDPATNVWTRRHDMPNTTIDGASGVIGGLLYVLTACPDPDDCNPFSVAHAFYRYDPRTDVWTRLPGPDLPLTGLPDTYRGGVIGGRFYVAWHDQLTVYDPATRQWTDRAGMPKLRWSAAGAVLAGRLHVIGGYGEDADGRTVVSRSHFVYDPASDSWAIAAPLPTARTRIAGSRVVVGGQARIEIMGGSRPGNNLQYIP